MLKFKLSNLESLNALRDRQEIKIKVRTKFKT